MGSHFIRNKKVLVTGASGSIGFAIASQFARRGSIVVLAGRNQAKLDEALANLPTLSEQPSQNEQLPSPINPLTYASLMARTHSTHSFDVRDIKGWKDVVAAHVSTIPYLHALIRVPCYLETARNVACNRRLLMTACVCRKTLIS
jgi:NAD(P)-dependent dehydrogenase (short-subunit alcohol dehydrogenase family)